MELSSISQLLLNQSRQSIADSLTKLIESGAIKPGTVLTAHVGRSFPLQGQQRQQLAHHWLNNSEKQDPTTQTSQKPTQQLENEARSTLIRQPKLLAIELKIHNSSQWVISEQNLQNGQRVQVQLREDRQFQLLNPSSKLTANTEKVSEKVGEKVDNQGKAASSSSLAAAATQFTKTADTAKQSASIKRHSPSSDDITANKNADSLDRESPNKVPAAKLDATKIRYYLRHTLPYEQNLPQVFKQLRQVLVSAESLKPDLRTAVAEPETWRVIEKLLSTVKSSQEIEHPKTLKSAIENSGVFYESKRLNKLVATATKNSGKQPGPIAENTNLSSPKIEGKQKTEVMREKASVDTKALLNELLMLTHSSEPAVANHPARSLPRPQQSSALLFHALNQLQGLDAKKQTTQEVASTVKQQIHSLARGALFKITGLQLQQLMQQTTEASPLSNAAMIELPVRISEQVLPLTLYIEEKPAPHEEEENKTDRKKKNQDKKRTTEWQVFLEFDLEKQGKFASQIKLVDNRVQAKFWTENPGLRSQAQQQISALKQKMEESGIEVSEFAVAHTSPPKRNTSLDYSLVNVTT